jgi:hypothetical protein
MTRSLTACTLVCLLVFSESLTAQKKSTISVYPPQARRAAEPALAAPVAAAPVAAAPAITATAPVTPPAANTPDASGKYKLREGEDVSLQFAQDLSSKTAAEGDPVAFTLVDDVKVGGVVVAKAGSKAFGEVSRAEKSGMMGKAGELSIRLTYLKVGEEKIKLRGTKGKEGESGVTSTIVLTVLFGPIGLIKHGKNVEIKQGQALHAYVADDISLLPVS